MILVLALLVGCFPDDYDTLGDPPNGGGPVVTDDSGGPVEGPAIVGEWLSQGPDLSELFAGDPFYYERVVATFGAEGSYRVAATDTSNETYVLSGTYTVGLGTEPATIVLTQTEPYAASAEGIWRVETDGTLTYEVVQTVPDYGFSPPTPAGGFGSTTGPNLDPGDNVQVYR